MQDFDSTNLIYLRDIGESTDPDQTDLGCLNI